MKKELQIDQHKRYLGIPIVLRGELCTVSIYSGARKIYEFQIPVPQGDEKPYSYDFSVYLPISPDYWGKLSLEGDFTETFAAAVTAEAEASHAESREHPCIHYAPDTGWMNDPNGLIYHEGVYHLYYQYNPFHVEWGNMSWGHAVSTDLLHWKQCDAVLFPDEDGVIYSGSAIENVHALLGLPKEAIIDYYTAAGNAAEWSRNQPYVQKIAYSVDGGYTLQKLGTTVPKICGENRDPKVIRHEASQAYIMCLWLEDDEFALLRSKDMMQWELTQKLRLEQGFECPNLFELKTARGESVWFIWTADGYYYQGQFDGRQFETDGIRREAWCGKNLYAAQIFSGIADRTVMIPWFRTDVRNQRYRGVMGLPQELYLAQREDEQQDGKWLLCMRPVREYRKQRKLLYQTSAAKLRGNARLSGCRYAYFAEYSVKQTGAVEMTVTCSSDMKVITWNLLGCELRYESTGGILCVSNVRRMLMKENRAEECRIETEEICIGQQAGMFSVIIDAGLLEINCDYDKIYAAELDMTNKTELLRVTSDGLCEVAVYTLE